MMIIVSMTRMLMLLQAMVAMVSSLEEFVSHSVQIASIELRMDLR